MTNSTHNSDQALQWYLKAAEAGDVPTMLHLAYVYIEGKNNVKQDYVQALYWGRKAAEAGNAEAMGIIGDMYYRGDGTEKNLAEAEHWTRMAAEGGDTFGMFCLGSMYNRGVGVTKDKALALHWFQKAANAGDDAAMCMVGYFYRDGEGGVPQDYIQAMQWYLKAAEAGDVDAMMEAAHEYHTGEHIQQDYGQALHWLQKAAEAGNVQAMYFTGAKYRLGEGVPQDANTALFWFRKGAEAGDADCMYGCATIYERTFNDFDHAMEYYRKAAALEHVESMYSIGELYLWWKGKIDQRKAFHWYKQAAEKGYIPAFTRLGMIYELGWGVPEDGILAMENFQKAADGGDSEAMEPLGMLYTRDLHNTRGQSSNADFKKAEYWLRKAISAGEDVDQEVLDEVTRRAQKVNTSLCFITTAVCDSFGKGDDCYELTMFRQFRDGWLKAQPDGEQLIREYYDIAPTIVKCIDDLDNAKEIYLGIWHKYLSPCLSMLEKKNLAECKAMYTEMVLTLKRQFINK